VKNIFDLELNTKVGQDSYIVSYPHILSYFNDLKIIESVDVVRGAHMIYGWMPTILDLKKTPNRSLDEVAKLLCMAKCNHLLIDSQIEYIASVVNKSLVGASKLLHFVAPNKYAIWDSKIYEFIHEKKASHHSVNNVDLYIEYLEIIKQLEQEKEFKSFHERVNTKIGYVVSSKRAVELIMFLNSPKSKN